MAHAAWIDDVRQWPTVTVEGIENYFIATPACDSQPNSKSLIEGQNYLRSGWVGKIQHQLLNDGKDILLQGQVRYSQMINKYHDVSVTLRRETAVVLDIKCDCMANQGMCCSHAAGLMYKLHQAVARGYTGQGCTDVSCAWNSGTSQNVLPDTVENIRLEYGLEPKSMSRLSTALETDADVIKHFGTGILKDLSAIPGTILHHVVTAKEHTCTLPKEINLPKTHGACSMQECDLCNDVYMKYVKIGDEKRKALARETANQDSELWLQQRLIRITSSEAKSVPKKADPKKWITRKLNNRFWGNAATRHGTECEPIARKQYSQDIQKDIAVTGLHVHPVDNWLGASPDGILDDATIIEIKCPTDQKLEQYDGSILKLVESGKYDIRSNNGIYFLRQTASGLGYYYQVQVTMHCTGKHMCKLIVWTRSKYIVVDVPYDQTWIQSQVEHLRQIYFGHLLPALADNIAYGHIQMIDITREQ